MLTFLDMLALLVSEAVSVPTSPRTFSNFCLFWWSFLLEAVSYA